ncbi:hydroxylysine kinase /5-phosphonooxy-L-lysine phospho-lyase apoenzyme [Rhizobium sp. RU33A]|uniref:aminotransferase class III-fold pyridoxal phosphate-dependent enzyme n=1 Tax=Rhizobium sp. RU33A TaxID=1907413 RepID=UPI0009558A3E|nr:aminotransferase class III-fold pyridoxal phosphate-dependent enzyme [Rhizobium sp. RU33A]SIQ85565.1 hydroxylysine kinase /5-phosphonooxy-L-lysine phospho-lyase apoenzyme [Rhizobium sp. RU33A]
MKSKIQQNGIDVLLASIGAPELGEEDVAARVRALYGLVGTLGRLGGEREQNFRLTAADGRQFVVKVASVDEPTESLEFQLGALDHVAAVDPGFPVPRVMRTLSGAPMASITNERGEAHVLRVLTFLPGKTLLDGINAEGKRLSADELVALGAMSGRLARALQGFYSRGAPKTMPWDLKNAPLLLAGLLHYMPERVSSIIADLLPALSETLTESLPKLRAQIIYNDFHESNVITAFDPSFSIAGVIDFGDMVFGPLVQDLAVTIASLIHWSSDPVFAAGCLVRGYQRFMPLEAADLAVLRDLVLARLMLQVGIVAYRTAGDDATPLDDLQGFYMTAIERIASVCSADFVSSMMPSVVPVANAAPVVATVAMPSLLKQREAVLGKTYTFYNEPLELVRGRGSKVWDAAGKEYLDCYNNVANLGHCHPYVVDALARQASTLNTNSRYLHREIVRLGERLSATLPAHLDTWIFVCTGSEANDLAVRMARAVSGNEGIVVTENSYHGNTSVGAPLSLIDYDASQRPTWVETLPPPNLYRGLYRQGDNDAGTKYAGHLDEAADRLEQHGKGLAGVMIDSIFDANGALVPPPDYLSKVYASVKRYGGLTIADEVQMGFARSGTHMWGFQAFDVEPDIVTMGKPMGNGHPIAAVVTRREIAAQLQTKGGYFNTFGGNTVSAVVGNACLDVLFGEDLQGNARRSSEALKAGLEKLQMRHEIIGHIQGRGLFLGVELVLDRDTKAPAKLAARWLREHMKAAGVLVSSTGPFGNIIKIRPPLAFSLADAERCLEALDGALGQVPGELLTGA